MKLSARRLDEPFLCGLLSITKIFMLSSFIPSSLLLYQTNALQPFCYITFRVGRTCPKALRYCRRRLQFLDIAHRSGYTAAPAGAERRYGLSRKVIRVEKSIHYPRHIVPPYCVSKLIQILHRCYRFYIYRKYRKINTFQKGRCTYACVAIVFLVGIAALSTFQSAKNNDSPFSDRLSLFLHSLK